MPVNTFTTSGLPFVYSINATTGGGAPHPATSFDLSSIPIGSLLNSGQWHLQTQMHVTGSVGLNNWSWVSQVFGGGNGDTFGTEAQINPGDTVNFDRTTFTNTIANPAIAAAFGSVLTGNVYPSFTTGGPIFQGNVTTSLLTLTIDYTPPAGPDTVVVTHQMDPLLGRGSRVLIATQVRYPAGYVAGIDLATKIGITQGQYQQFMSVRGPYIANLVGTVLRLYAPSGAELTGGSACDGVDILSVGF